MMLRRGFDTLCWVTEPTMPSRDVSRNGGTVTRADRRRMLGAAGATAWFTGLPGSGTSTLAAAMESELVRGRRAEYRLDGDDVRTGLHGDLDFSPTSRNENVRRVAQVACLFAG